MLKAVTKESFGNVHKRHTYGRLSVVSKGNFPVQVFLIPVSLNVCKLICLLVSVASKSYVAKV